MKEGINSSETQSGVFLCKIPWAIHLVTELLGIVSPEAEMFVSEGKSFLRLIQKGRESSNVSLWFCSALLTLCNKHSGQKTGVLMKWHKTASSHSLRKEWSLLFLFEAYHNMGSHHSL